MMVSRKIAGLLLAVGLFPLVSRGGDGTKSSGDLEWLAGFFSKGIHSASADYSRQRYTIDPGADQFYQRYDYAVDYRFSEKRYTYSFSYEYRDSWDRLTNNNTTSPPKEDLHFTGSSVTPWNVKDGLGTYREKYERSIPNWLIFEDLDSLIVRQCQLGNPLPAITGIFFSDELKAMKRLYRRSRESGGGKSICSYFDYDEDGNVMGISPTHLSQLSATALVDSKRFETCRVVITNNELKQVSLEILTHPDQSLLIEGVRLGDGEHSVSIFSFEINSLLHKFVPELVTDPRELIRLYLRQLQEECDHEFVRFEVSEGYVATP